MDEASKESNDVLIQYDWTLLWYLSPITANPQKFGGLGAHACYQKCYLSAHHEDQGLPS